MTTAFASTPATDDMWEQADALYRLAQDLGSALEGAPDLEAAHGLLRELMGALPETPEALGDVDPYLRSALLLAVIHALRAWEERDRTDFRVAAEQLRQAARDIADERPVWRAGPKDAALWLKSKGLTANDISQLAAVSDSTARRWVNEADESSPGGEHADRVIVIAKILNHLRHAMTARGATQWLKRPHPALDDRRPIDELKDPSSYRFLVHLAAGTRSHVAT
jgi:hypothetical protein